MTTAGLIKALVAQSLGLEVKAPANLQHVHDRGWFRVLESYAGAWQSNVEVSLDGVLQHPTVFACVTLIAFDVAKLRIRLVEEREPDVWVEIENPAFSPVLRVPNAYQTRIQFYITWMISKLIHGNTYVLLQRDGRNVVVAEYVLDPNRVRALVAPDGAVFYEVRRDNISRVQADVITVPASEIIHDVYAALYHPLVGVGPIHAIGVAATQAQHIQSNATNFYANSAQPGGTLTAPGTIPPETAARVKAEWEANYGGENRGKVAILGDSLKYEPLKFMSAEDAQVIEQLKWSDEKICSAYHVPGFKIGVGPFPPYNSSVELNQDYYSTGVQIHLESIELLQDRAMGLESKVGDRRIGTEFDTDGLVRMNPAAQIDAEGNAVAKSLKAINEARKKLNLPSVKGGDTIWSQQQNFSIEALFERDQNQPFAKVAPPTPTPDPAPPAEDKAATRLALRKAIDARLRRAA